VNQGWCTICGPSHFVMRLSTTFINFIYIYICVCVCVCVCVCIYTLKELHNNLPSYVYHFLNLTFAASDPGHNISCGPLPTKTFGHPWGGYLPRLPFMFSGHGT